MLYEALKPFLFSLDAERAHEEVSGLMALLAPLPGAAALLSALTGPGARGLETTAFGVRFPNPLGLAAGFDKDGRLTQLVPALGFGFLDALAPWTASRIAATSPAFCKSRSPGVLGDDTFTTK